ncbi:hypothetical protein [Aliivibrio fischeri]|uniref:hypothetical protein n=1 Tax=Aliivibrio fischeri TaxID=668 RepID=UPI0007C4D837|nr:hypothetical protein [Aliivibrio fischeri]
MTKFEKTEKGITILCAVVGCFLSLYLFIKDIQDTKPTLYSSYSILPEVTEPKLGKTDKVRMDVTISNTGKEEVEIPPIISITIFDTVSREERQITANLLGEKGEELTHIIPTTLKQGKTRLYRTSYENISYFWDPHVSTVIQMWSGDDLFIAPTEPSKNPEAIKLMLDHEIMNKHFGNIKSYPSKFLKLEEL